MITQSLSGRYEGEVTMKTQTLRVTQVVDATMKTDSQLSDDGYNKPQYPNDSSYREGYSKHRNYDRGHQQRDCSMASQDSVDDGYSKRYLDASPNSRIVPMGSPEPDNFQNNLDHNFSGRNNPVDHQMKVQEQQRQ
jgi:hypothetical protein